MTELQQILQKLSELDGKLSDFRGEVNIKFAQVDGKFAEVNTKLSDSRGEVNTKFGEVNTKLAQVDTKISELKGEITTSSAKLEGKFDTEFAKLEGKFDTELATLGGKIDNLPERIKLVEASAGKITDLSEKVGEGRGWRQLVQPFLTTLVTLLIGGGINWILGVYRVVK